MDYQGNSHKDKETKKEKPEVEKVVTGQVVSKPKGIGTRFKSVFLGGEFKDASRYLTGEVLLPAIRNLLVDAVRIGTERIVYGESARRRPPVGGYDRYAPRVTYNNPINRGGTRDPRERERGYIPNQPGLMASRRKEGNDIFLSSREEAELVLERLTDIINQYDVASLADLYDLVGLPSSHTDNKWGWTFLNDVDIRQVREGYLIDLPAAEPI